MREKILEALKSQLEKMVEEGTEIEIHEAKKNNGIELLGVCLKKPGQSIFPTIYIDREINEVLNGRMTVHRLAEYVVKENRKHQRKKVPGLEGFSKEMILGNVKYQLINKEMNKDKMADVPHKEFLDLVAVYRVEVKISRAEKGSFLLNNQIIKTYGITYEELDAAAKKNTGSAGFSVRSMGEVMAEMGDMSVEDIEMVEAGGPGIFVMTNADKINGAVIMLYKEYFEKLANRLNEDLFIIPSSIHELLALPADTMSEFYVRTMVKEVNDTEVAIDEILSYNVYRYRRESGELEVA